MESERNALTCNLKSPLIPDIKLLTEKKKQKYFVDILHLQQFEALLCEVSSFHLQMVLQFEFLRKAGIGSEKDF